MRKKGILLIAGMVLCIICTACGNKEELDESKVEALSPTPVPEASSSPTPEGFPVVSDREVVDGQMQSYLTGEWKDESVVTRRPIAVMIPNNSPAMPQYGISKASIIYEAPVEGRITRLMAVVEDFDDLERIGPVRSSRDYFLYVAMG